MKVESSFATQLYAAARRMAPAEQQPSAAQGPSGPGPVGQALAADGMAAQKPAGAESFARALEATMAELSTRLGTGEDAARKAMLGEGDVQSVVEALTSAELALETAVTVRDKVVEAYQEILRMPI